MLQKALITKMYLYYHNFKRQLYADLNESKRYEFKIIIYHVLKDPQNNFFSIIDIQFFFFLFKLLNVAKLRY